MIPQIVLFDCEMRSPLLSVLCRSDSEEAVSEWEINDSSTFALIIQSYGLVAICRKQITLTFHGSR